MTIEQRLAKLERSVKLWRLFGCVGLLLCVGMGAAGVVEHAVFNTVRAKAFIVEDDKGNIRGIMGFATPDSENMLTVIGKDGVSGWGAAPGSNRIKVTGSDKSVSYIE